MTPVDERIIEDVKFILNSGDENIIKILKLTISAYLECIAINRRKPELIANQKLLLEKQQEILENKKKLVALKRKETLLREKKQKLSSAQS